MTSIQELAQNGEKIRKNIEETFNDPEKYEALTEQQRTEMIKDYMFIQAYELMGGDDIDIHNDNRVSTKIYKELNVGHFMQGKKDVETGSNELAEGFATLENGGLLLRTLQTSSVKRVMFGTSFDGRTNTKLKDKLFQEIGRGNLEDYLVKEEEKSIEKKAQEEKNREARAKQAKENRGKAAEEEARREEEAAERRRQEREAEKARHMRPMNELLENASAIKQEIEASFSDPEKFNALSKDQKTGMIREYMFLQAMDEPEMPKDEPERTQALEKVYSEINRNSFTHNRNTVNGINEPYLEQFSLMEDGLFLLAEIAMDIAKDLFFGRSLRNGLKPETSERLRDYLDALKTGVIKGYREREAREKQEKEQREQDIDDLVADAKEILQNDPQQDHVPGNKVEEPEQKKVTEGPREEPEQKKVTEAPREERVLTEEEKKAFEKNSQEHRNRLAEIQEAKEAEFQKKREEKIEKQRREREEKEKAERELKRKQIEEEQQRKAEEEKRQQRDRARQNSENRKQENEAVKEEGKREAAHYADEFGQREAGRKELSQDYAKAESEKLFNRVKKVDFNMLGKGSPEFKAMKQSLKDLKDYANSSDFDPAVYYDKQRDALKATEGYLNKKQNDFLQGISDKNDPSKQKREQPRIHAATEIFSELERSYAAGRNAVIENERDRAKSTLSAEVETEGKRRTEGRLNEAELKASVAKSAAITANLNGHGVLYDVPGEGKSLKNYKETMQKNTAALKDVKNVKKNLNEPVFKNIWNRVSEGMNDYGFEFKEAFGAENVAKCAEEVKFDNKKPSLDTGLNKNIPDVSEKVKGYKNELFSDATKKKVGMKAEQPKVEKKQEKKKETNVRKI